MRILITQETDWLRRYPAQQHHLAEMMSLRGHEVRVIDYELLWRTQGRKELYSRRQVFNNVTKIHKDARITVIRPGIIKIPSLDYVSLLFSHKKEIEQQIKEFHPDVVIGFGILNSYLATMTAKKSHVPFVYYWIDVLHRLIPHAPFKLIGKLVESPTLKRSHRILVINDKLRDCVIGLGASPERTEVLRAGINTKKFNPASDDGAVRKRYGLKKEDVVLFFMGWLYHFSGIKEVALELTKDKNHNLKLLVVGEGDAYDELQKIREDNDLQETVILAGERTYQEIPSFIAAADICLLTAYPWEQIMQDIVPIKLYEYMAMSKPVIATKLPGVVREFGEGNGIVYVDRPEDVPGKATELVTNSKLNELGAKARSFAERNTWDRAADEFEKTLKEVIKEKENE